jgi:exopolyphosphatase/guanosine-5'-triphosphate,3'-diphosphate pyrophosphatase
VRIAVIDIGTNTVLLLVAEIDSAGRISTLEYRQRVPRLGRGVDERKILQHDSMERVLGVLMEYRSVIGRYHPEAVAVCGTSAVRDAANKDEFSFLVKERTGWNLEVLSGEEEALWTYRGAISGIQGPAGATVVDIGGGSTELTRGTAHEITAKTSLNIGSVRLTERLMSHDPPVPGEITAVRDAIKSALASMPSSLLQEPGRVVGVAGTATTLALLVQRRKTFDLQAVSGYNLDLDEVRKIVALLQKLPNSEILQMGDYMEGRNDIIAAGAIILDEVMDFLGAKEITVSERGVRYGIAIREWEKSKIIATKGSKT